MQRVREPIGRSLKPRWPTNNLARQYEEKAYGGGPTADRQSSGRMAVPLEWVVQCQPFRLSVHVVSSVCYPREHDKGTTD